MKPRCGFKDGLRQLTAVALAVWMIPFTLGNLYGQEMSPATYTPMEADQLNQLVAPIALYPDSLVAQILTAATYPQQVSSADEWLHQNMGLPPAQRAQLANGMPWDPSVKALTAFPAVLDNLARNYNWSSTLGNAYYNQPGDVMNAVQAMRYQAQRSGALVSTPQQRVYTEGGEIIVAPVNPAVVYVPYYNPWRVWAPGVVVAYPGFYVPPPPPGLVLGVGVGIGFAAGISVGLFASYGWGWHAWAPRWGGGVVVYNNTTYISRSTTVINRGNFGGYNRGVYEHEAHGVPAGFHAPVTREGFARGAGRPEGPRGVATRPMGGQPGTAAARPEGRPGGFAHAEPGRSAEAPGHGNVPPGHGNLPPGAPHAAAAAPHAAAPAPAAHAVPPHPAPAPQGHPQVPHNAAPQGHQGGQGHPGGEREHKDR